MKKNITLFLLLCTSAICYCQNIGIGNNNPNANAKLEISDTTRGLLIPRMDSTHRINIPNTVGLLVYDSTTNSFWYNDGSKWLNLINSNDIKNASLEYPDGINNIIPVVISNLSTTPYTVPDGYNLYIQRQITPSNVYIIGTSCSAPASNTITDWGFAIVGSGKTILSSNNNATIFGYLAHATVNPFFESSDYIVPAGKTLVILKTGPLTIISINGKTTGFEIDIAKGTLPILAKGGDIISGGCFNGYLK